MKSSETKTVGFFEKSALCLRPAAKPTKTEDGEGGHVSLGFRQREGNIIVEK